MRSKILFRFWENKGVGEEFIVTNMPKFLVKWFTKFGWIYRKTHKVRKLETYKLSESTVEAIEHVVDSMNICCEDIIYIMIGPRQANILDCEEITHQFNIGNMQYTRARSVLDDFAVVPELVRHVNMIPVIVNPFIDGVVPVLRRLKM